MYRIYAIFAAVSMLLLSAFYIHHLRSKIADLEKENSNLKQSLQICMDNYNDLLNKTKLHEDEYRKKVTDLLKKANKPVRVIKVPQQTPIQINIPTDDCKKMGYMIDEYIREDQK